MQTDFPPSRPPVSETSSDKEKKSKTKGPVMTSLSPVKPPPSRDGKDFSKKRKVLGRGLDSLFGSASETHDLKKNLNFSPPPSRAFLLGIEQLVPGSHQPRKVFDRESLETLADSIKQNGLIQPIIVKKSGEKYEIVAGERRWRAAAEAGLHEVPVWVLREKTHSAVLALVENIQRENLNPMEQALAYHRLLREHQWTQEQLSEALALPRPSLANYLRLLNLHPEVQALVMQKKLSMAVAKLLLQEADPLSQLKWARVFVSQNLSVRAAGQRLSKKANQSPKKGKKLTDTEQQALQKIQNLYNTPASLHFKNKGGKLSLSFYSREQMNQLLDQLLRTPSPKG